MSDLAEQFVDLRTLVSPRSVAIVGASATKTQQITNFRRMGFDGVLYAVNPGHDEIDGVRCFKTLADLPQAVDLAYILVGASQVEGVLREVGERGIPAAVVVASGFAETGRSDAQARLGQIARDSGVLLCGPNCTGILNLEEGIPASISQVADIAERRAPGGRCTAFVSQSGAFGTTIAALALEEEIGLGYFVGCGNEAALTVADYVNYFAGHDGVDTIACYIEQLRDGSRFLAAARAAWQAGKVVIAVKSGRSEAGQRAVRSHTASIAGEDSVYDAAFRQAHVIRAEDEGHILDLLKWQQMRRRGIAPRGRRTAIVTMSGGAGALLSDLCAGQSLPVEALSQATQARIRPLWPPFASMQNPIDVTGVLVRDAGNLPETLAVLEADDDVDNILLYVNLGHHAADQIADAAASEKSKPLGFVWQQAPKDSAAKLRRLGVPVFNHTRRAVVSLASWLSHSHDDSALEAVDRAADGQYPVSTDQRSVTSEGEALAILEGYGLEVVEHRQAAGWREIREAAGDVGYPCVLKVDSPLVPHRSDIGAVVVGIGDETQLEQAYGSIRQNLDRAGLSAIGSFLVEPHLTPLAELLLGVKADSTFGHVLVVALGGIWAEQLHSACQVILPASRDEIADAILRIPGIEIIRGARGRPPADLDSIFSAAEAVARFAAAQGHALRELDVNPLMVLEPPQGSVAADALIIWDGSEKPARSDQGAFQAGLDKLH